jgi:hypothetical protein
VVLKDGTIIEISSNFYIRYTRSEIDRLKKEGYLVKDIGEKEGYCAILYDMWMRRSTDGGKTWEKKAIHPQFGFLAYWVTFGGVAVLDDGVVVAFGYGQRRVEDRKSTYIVRSKDKGDTWEAIKIADGQLSPSDSGFNECFPVVYPDGRIFVMLRTRLTVDAYCVRSMDGGLTWSKPEKTSVRAKHPLVTRLSDDTIVCTYPRRFRPYGIRARLTSDFGKTWSDEVVLRDDFEITDGLSWSLTQELPDGTLFTVMNGKKYVDLKGKLAQNYIFGSRWTRDYRKPMGPEFPIPPRARRINVDKRGKSPWG